MSYQIKNRAVIHELLDDEAIIAHLETGIYYSIRGNGIPIWQSILAGVGIEAIAKKANQIYQRDVSAEVGAFIDRLLEEELIVPAFDSNPSCCNPNWPEDWKTPSLEKYEEMQNLLALDPIHEVDELGWPKKGE